MASPIYEERDCPICASRKIKHCADCSKPIPTEATDYGYKHMAGNGYQSLTSDHRHTKMVRGEIGFGQATRELCRECYRVDFAKFYPAEPLPV